MNISDALDRSARDRPLRPAIEDGDRIVAYAELATMARTAATALLASGIASGDMVAVALPDSAEHVAVLYALARLGAASLSIDRHLPEPEMLRATAGLAIKAAIVANERDAIAGLRAIAAGTLFAAARAVDPAPTASGGSDADEALMLIQSSGTTGAPKRLLLTHRQMAARNRRLIAAMQLGPADRYFQTVSLSFLSGRRRCMSMIAVGGTVVLNHAQSIDRLLACLSELSITYTALTPAHLRPLLDCITGSSPFCPGLRATVSTAPVSNEERLLARRRLTPHIFESYGTNELGDLTLASPADQDRRPRSIGRALDGIRAEVVDDEGRAVPYGESGLIRFKAPDSPEGYLDNPDATARHFKDGWFYPGDRAALSEDGYVFFMGRADEAINNAGAKFYPPEVEAVLATHPRVAEAAVIAAPHPQFGEVAVAFVVASGAPPYPDLSAYCIGKLALHKIPGQVLFLNAMPKIRTGKPDKTRLTQVLHRLLEEQARAARR
jgi:acyl-coenzyme A synthetase/AMP-(fatty) acid ligase